MRVAQRHEGRVRVPVECGAKPGLGERTALREQRNHATQADLSLVGGSPSREKRWFALRADP
jgi:hypothetical protein